jgi:glutamate formiminotransferase/formiminotetrahydrofolate cyclodeaminase
VSRIVECVPNFSEGRDVSVIEKIASSISSVPGVRLLDREMDAAHHRSVFTMVGGPDDVAEAAFQAAKAASALIDLNHHKGEHPRMGAVDVIPFVPIRGVTMDEAVQLARRVGGRIGDELAIPVFLYEAAATRPDRQNLAEVRRGEFEGLREEIGKNPARRPDFGPERVHPTAGAVAVGARMPLVAFNVNLATKDVKIAQAIAKAVRGATGGLAFVKALGFVIEERGIVQVSMNLVDVTRTPIQRVFALVREEADRYGVSIIGSEVVGLVPEDALLDVAEHHLRLERFDREQVLERRLWTATTGSRAAAETFLDAVASPEPTPGGGSVSAFAGSVAAALGSMVAGLTMGKKKYAAVADEMRATREKAESLRRRLAELIEEDGRAFREMMSAARMLGVDPALRASKVQEATRRACEVPLEVIERASEVAQIALVVAEKGNPNAASDAGVAALLAEAAARGASLNVRINVPGLDDQAVRAELLGRAGDGVERTASRARDVLRIVESRLEGRA